MSAERPEQPAGRPLAGAAQRYLGAALAGDVEAAMAVVLEALEGGHAWAAVSRDVLAPAMHDVGRMWESRELGVADEHLTSEVTASVIARTAPLPVPRAQTTALAVVACVAPERHTLGGQALGAALAAEGWRVVSLGAETPAMALERFAALRAARAVVMSVKLPRSVEAALASTQRLKALREPPLVVLGGTAVRRGATRDWGAVDLVTDDIGEAAAWLAARRPA